MKNAIVLLPICLLFTALLFFGIKWMDSKDELRTIEVTGSAEMEVEPDEIKFVIGICEYRNYDHVTSTRLSYNSDKIKLDSIETKLMQGLTELGINTRDIKVNSASNYQYYASNEPMNRKEFELSLSQLAIVDSIMANCSGPGIQYMRLGELRNSEIEGYREKVKMEALLAAQKKAEYLAISLNDRLGNAISITEVNSSDYSNPWFVPQAVLSNSIIPSVQSGSNLNLKTIKLRYEMTAIFEIYK